MSQSDSRGQTEAVLNDGSMSKKLVRYRNLGQKVGSMADFQIGSR